MKKYILSVCLVALIAGLSVSFNSLHAQNTPPSAPPPPAAPTPPPIPMRQYPAMHRAISMLRMAKSEMQRASHDFGGHRQSAMDECDKAMAELEAALKSATPEPKKP